MQSRFSVTLPAPRMALFAFLADPRNRPRWQSSIASLTMTTDGEPRVGMTWHEHARGFGRFEMEITECVEGQSWAERGRSSRGEIDVRLTFRDGARPRSTTIDVTMQLALAGPLRAVSWLAPTILRPLMTRDLRRAATLAPQ